MELSIDSSKEVVRDYLVKNRLLDKGALVFTLESPGDSNMNSVVRAKTNAGNFILKQSRPYVNKYPDIPAPINRINIEYQFYELSNKIKSAGHFLPKILLFDPSSHLMVIEDLDEASDYSFLYQKGINLTKEEFISCLSFIDSLHSHDFAEAVKVQFPDNLELRALNHQHIFKFPFMVDNGMDLDSIDTGLQEVAMRYKKDESLVNKARELGESYLSMGNHLLHGDYYPGSWLRSKDGFKVIDPEFCFFGPPEFDLGVLKAHLSMAQQDKEYFELLDNHYEMDLDRDLLDQFEGIEVMRRIIGLAQLPLDLSLEEKEALLEYAYHKLMLNA